MATWNLTGMDSHLFICEGGTCKREGAEEVTEAIRHKIRLNGADSRIHTTRTRCNGRCEDACVVIQYPEGNWYRDMTPVKARRLVASILNGSSLEEQLLYSYSDRLIPVSTSAAAGIEKPAAQPGPKK